MENPNLNDGHFSACDTDEAPEGYYAVPKASFNRRDGNICRECDWRATCNDPTTDLLAPGHRCMSYAIVAERDGQNYQRLDGCSVVFKRHPTI